MRVYLDICCFNRPFDDQSQLRVRLEAEAKLAIQEAIRDERIELAWSYIMDFENSANPFQERKESIAPWRKSACVDLIETTQIITKSEQLSTFGIKAKDALHLASAIAGECQFFITTDRGILNKADRITDLAVISPIDYVSLSNDD